MDRVNKRLINKKTKLNLQNVILLMTDARDAIPAALCSLKMEGTIPYLCCIKFMTNVTMVKVVCFFKVRDHM